MEIELGNFRDFRFVCCANCQQIYLNSAIASEEGNIRVGDKMNFLLNWQRKTRRDIWVNAYPRCLIPHTIGPQWLRSMPSWS